jgi:hypothetical protein
MTCIGNGHHKLTSPNNQNLLWHYTVGATSGNIQKTAHAFSSKYLYTLFSKIQRYKPPSHTTNSNTLYIANTAICRFIAT